MDRKTKLLVDEGVLFDAESGKILPDSIHQFAADKASEASSDQSLRQAECERPGSHKRQRHE